MLSYMIHKILEQKRTLLDDERVIEEILPNTSEKISLTFQKKWLWMAVNNLFEVNN